MNKKAVLGIGGSMVFLSMKLRRFSMTRTPGYDMTLTIRWTKTVSCYSA